MLSGDLGAGKTSFARGLIQALCGNLEVASPTFMLLQTYDTENVCIHHYDLYRIKHIEELYELGIEEQIGCSILLVEWPEMAGEFDWGRDRLDIHIQHESEQTRSLRFTASKSMLPALDKMKALFDDKT